MGGAEAGHEHLEREVGKGNGERTGAEREEQERSKSQISFDSLCTVLSSY